MKPITSLLLFITLSLLSFEIFAQEEFACHNDIVLENSLLLQKKKNGEWFFMESCSGEFLEFVGTGNYQDWQKVAPRQEDPLCATVGSQVFSNPRRINWVLLSPKVLAGESAFIQISYESLSEYGPKNIKTFLKCLRLERFDH